VSGAESNRRPAQGGGSGARSNPSEAENAKRRACSWLAAIGLAIVGSVLAAALMVRASRRIVFWL